MRTHMLFEMIRNYFVADDFLFLNLTLSNLTHLSAANSAEFSFKSHFCISISPLFLSKRLVLKKKKQKRKQTNRNKT